MFVDGIPDVDPDVEVTQVDVTGEVTNQTVSVWEMRMGAETNWPTPYGEVFARVGVEAQLGELPPVLFGRGDENIGLFGPTFAIGLVR